METAFGQAPMTIDSAEDGSFLDRGLTDPGTQGPNPDKYFGACQTEFPTSRPAPSLVSLRGWVCG